MNKKKKIRDFNALTRDIAIILNQVLESAGVATLTGSRGTVFLDNPIFRALFLLLFLHLSKSN